MEWSNNVNVSLCKLGVDVSIVYMMKHFVIDIF